MCLVGLNNWKCWPDPLGDGREDGILGKASPAENIGAFVSTSGLVITNEVSDCSIVTESNVTRFEGWNFAKELGLRKKGFNAIWTLLLLYKIEVNVRLSGIDANSRGKR